MRRPTPRFRDALEVLARHGVKFIVVGGVAAVPEGAPIVNARLARNATGDVAMALMRPLRDGRTALTFTPVEFLRPTPRAHAPPPPYFTDD